MDVIVFRAYKPKTQQPVKVCPLPELKAGGKHFTGQGKTGYYENLTPQEKEELSYVVTPDTFVLINDGKALKLEDPMDAANWKWIQKHPYVAMDRREGHSNRDAAYYIENKEKEADTIITKDKLVTEAKTAMYGANREKLDVVAKALGHPSPEGFSEKEVQKYLNDVIDATPQSVLDAFNPENQAQTNVRSLMTDLERHKIVVKSRGSYFYGGEHGIFLGRSEQEVVDFLMDTNNKGTVDSMNAQMIEMSQENVAING